MHSNIATIKASSLANHLKSTLQSSLENHLKGALQSLPRIKQ